ncbi:hypothetical protein EYF80_050812 [Liparis tanakae]|uniref:Uncharacterized protein n=1 Tax=Liparis tanakae TaxID=230148 RepID=A0A4Z2FDN4_9TELE|nr:hypothetical protein EYF80_050812 [Liparis tanakae]
MPLKSMARLGSFPLPIRVHTRGYLALRSADEIDGRPNPDRLGFGLLDCHLNGFGRDTCESVRTCDNDLRVAPVGAALVSAGTDVDSGITRLDVGEAEFLQCETVVIGPLTQWGGLGAWPGRRYQVHPSGAL